jgi:hypothetical protein
VHTRSLIRWELMSVSARTLTKLQKQTSESAKVNTYFYSIVRIEDNKVKGLSCIFDDNFTNKNIPPYLTKSSTLFDRNGLLKAFSV